LNYQDFSFLRCWSTELAEAVAHAFKDPQTHLAILKNHGLVSVGEDFNDAIQKAAFFEMVCRTLLTHPNATPLDADAVNHLRADGAKA
jgi:ribulose-5-phosphate 4-epimerase/fuculose-1-phosphate aldolase